MNQNLPKNKSTAHSTSVDLRTKSLLFVLLLFILPLTSCKQYWQLATVESQQIQISQELPVDSTINEIIVPYRTSLSATMDKVIGNSAVDLLKAKPEGTLNNFVADLLYEKSTEYYGPIDFAVANYGGLRIPSIPAGSISLGKAYELMPFDNMIVILKMNGQLVQQLLDRIADYGGWPVSKELRFQIEDGIAKEVSIGGEDLDFQKTYTFSIPDYIANGGDKCDFLKDAERTDVNVLIRDAIIKHIEEKHAKKEFVSALLDGRISFKEN